MIYAATVNGMGLTAGTYSVTPLYTRIDGTDAPAIDALPINGLVPAAGDTVYCAEGINDLAQSMQLLINDNGGAYPIIIASISRALVYDHDTEQFKGKITLGEGGKKMVLGEPLETWAKAVDAEIKALYAWAATGVAPGPTGGIAPFPGTPAQKLWGGTETQPIQQLSNNHELD